MRCLVVALLWLSWPLAAYAQDHGIVYSDNSKMVRRIISGATNFAVHVGAGEALLVVQQPKTPTVFEAEAAVQAATGVAPASTSVAVVDDKGVIKSIIKADPTIDVVPNASLVPLYADGITTDATYDAKTGLFTMPVVVIKAGTVLKDGTVVKTDTQIGGVIAKPDATIDAVPVDSSGIVAKPMTP